MDIILLGGNSVDNKEWIEEIEFMLKPYFKSTHIQYYDHWKTGSEMINLDIEVDKLIDNVKSKKQYVIFAKSAGSLVAVKAIFDGKMSPTKCFFVGIPINWAHEYNFDIDKWFKSFRFPLTIIQHTNDPITSIQELRKFLIDENVTGYNLVEWPGKDHYYQEFDKIKALVISSV